MDLRSRHPFIGLALLLTILSVFLTLLNGRSVMHAEDAAGEPELVDSSEIKKFTNAELRSLIAPIALYPDSLLAQVLPASTYPLQIVAAYRHVQSSKTPTAPPSSTNWDISVIALLNYPPVLKKMNDDLEWTERLGLAVTYQMNEVSDTIQQVRAEAAAAGNLVSNEKQTVVRESEVIRIVPADPTIIYVPSYEPDVIFIAHDSWQPYINFGIGFGVGLWLDDYWDWHHHYFYRHHVWYGGSWHRPTLPYHWQPPYRPVPSWHRRPSYQPPVTGYRGGTASPKTPTSPRPTQPHFQPNHSESARPAPPRPHGLSEGLERPGQDVKRDALRGQTSRQPTQPTARPYSPPHQNPMAPSDGRTTGMESNRGSTSRHGSAGTVRRR